ncbi:MAG: ubiquinol-cytochrome c reductase cytochrome b subunit [Corynebacteriales bacterium]|nr:ubiquinol-cytochrome c reductase cytochrome b subunit [Mycobacteriales bacterium]
MKLLPKIKPAQLPAAGAKFVDDRLTVATPMRRIFNKVFPDHWSFMLGEIALYSFVVLLLTGTFLTLFFDPSMTEVVYDGSYTPLKGVEMSRAYATSLDISFDVRGGLIMRQIHHWAALVFVGAMTVHMFRTFFTGAFRKPRELNWLIGIGLLTLGMLEGFAGYSIPDDALSGTGLRIMNAIILSIPLVGTWVAYAIFGGEFPGGGEIIPRLYITHVLLIPAILVGLVAAHMALLVKQKHTQFPGKGRTEKNVMGERMFPGFAAKGGGFFMIVFGVLAMLGGWFQINPIWLFGPYKGEVVSAGSQPDFYVGWIDGWIRLWPAWETRNFDYTIPAVFWPSVVFPGVVFTLAALWPFLEAKFTKDVHFHNLLQRPRDVPARTGLGAMVVSVLLILLISGGNDIIAEKFDISLNAMTWAGRIGLIIVPPLVYFVTYRICLGLQQHDREVLAHGLETGIIKRLPHGEFIEVHQPLGEVDEHGHTHLEYAGAPVPKKMNKIGATGAQPRGVFFPVERRSDVEAEQKALAGGHKE